MLMATHDSLSDEYVDRVLRLQDGQILSIEAPTLNPGATDEELLLPVDELA